MSGPRSLLGAPLAFSWRKYAPPPPARALPYASYLVPFDRRGWPLWATVLGCQAAEDSGLTLVAQTNKSATPDVEKSREDLIVEGKKLLLERLGAHECDMVRDARRVPCATLAFKFGSVGRAWR